jgi:hypothetical protein
MLVTPNFSPESFIAEFQPGTESLVNDLSTPQLSALYDYLKMSELIENASRSSMIEDITNFLVFQFSKNDDYFDHEQVPYPMNDSPMLDRLADDAFKMTSSFFLGNYDFRDLEMELENEYIMSLDSSNDDKNNEGYNYRFSQVEKIQYHSDGEVHQAVQSNYLPYGTSTDKLKLKDNYDHKLTAVLKEKASIGSQIKQLTKEDQYDDLSTVNILELKDHNFRSAFKFNNGEVSELPELNNNTIHKVFDQLVDELGMFNVKEDDFFENRLISVLDKIRNYSNQMPKHHKVAYLPSDAGKTVLAMMYPDQYVDIDSFLSRNAKLRLVLIKLSTIAKANPKKWKLVNLLWNLIYFINLHKMKGRILLAHGPEQIEYVVTHPLFICILPLKDGKKEFSKSNYDSLLRSQKRIFKCSHNLYHDVIMNFFSFYEYAINVYKDRKKNRKNRNMQNSDSESENN